MHTYLSLHLRVLVIVVISSPWLCGSARAQVPPYTAEDFPADDPGYYFLTTLDFGGNNLQSQMLILDAEIGVDHFGIGADLLRRA